MTFHEIQDDHVAWLDHERFHYRFVTNRDVDVPDPVHALLFALWLCWQD